MSSRPWTPEDLAVKPVSWLDCDTARTDTDTDGIVGVYDKEGHSFRPMSGYGYTIGESHINGRRWLGAVSPRDGNFRLSLGCMTASGWFQGKPGVTVVGTWWRFTLANLYGGMIAINNVDENGSAATTQAQAMVKVSPSSISTGGILYNWRRLSTDTRTQSTRSTGLSAADCGLVLSTRLDALTAKASLRVGTSAAWGSLEAQSGITPGMLAGCTRSAYQVMYGFERANMSGNQDMALGEALIYAEALTDADVALVEGYLAHKWGVAESLPDSHPYKSTPPVVELPDPEPIPPLIDAGRNEGGSLQMALDETNQTFDLVLDGGNLATDAGLSTAVQISLFTDARIGPDEARDKGIGDRRGYWADKFSASGPWGSTIWAARRAGVSPETARLVEERALTALQWLVQAGAAERVTARAVAVIGSDTPHIALTIRVQRSEDAAARYGSLWEVSYVV